VGLVPGELKPVLSEPSSTRRAGTAERCRADRRSSLAAGLRNQPALPRPPGLRERRLDGRDPGGDAAVQHVKTTHSAFEDDDYDDYRYRRRWDDEYDQDEYDDDDGSGNDTQYEIQELIDS
jgi:hypothetical protein